MVHDTMETASHDWKHNATQKLCENALQASPDAHAAMLKQFDQCNFFYWDHEETNSYNIRNVMHRLRCPWGLEWLWHQVTASNLLDLHIATIAENLNKKLISATGYAVKDHYCGGLGER